ncbi:hypothetical protein [uncultured Maritalea sp.]|uniref:hypothetical protein n=1 Tax=uncultured Maritalea sp. TaxID=757249 RepID=UPI0026183F85|nr:hypothetical protein [uncultured Maritalea sp.]
MRIILLLIVILATSTLPARTAENRLNCANFKDEIRPILKQFGTIYDDDGYWEAGSLGHSYGSTTCDTEHNLAHFNSCAILKFPKAAGEFLALLETVDELLNLQTDTGADLMSQAYSEYLTLQAAGASGLSATARSRVDLERAILRFTVWSAAQDVPHTVCVNLDMKQ